MSVDKNKNLWDQAKAETLASLYKNDPLIRESLDMQLSKLPTPPKPSAVLRDAQGNVTGVEGGSVLSGRNANSRAATELWGALRDQLLTTNKKNEEKNDGE